MGDLRIRKATPRDTDAVLEFYHNVIDEMQGTDFDILWKRDVHPSDDFLASSIQNGHLIIGAISANGRADAKGKGQSGSSEEQEEIACALVIDHERAPGYEKVPWQVEAPLSDVGIVHAVITRASHHGKGYATKLFESAIDMSREQGLRSLQLDTFVDNVRSHGLYEKLGFIDHGPHPVYYEDLGTCELDFFEYVL